LNIEDHGLFRVITVAIIAAILDAGDRANPNTVKSAPVEKYVERADALYNAAEAKLFPPEEKT
jgi:hypothetical protein